MSSFDQQLAEQLAPSPPPPQDRTTKWWRWGTVALIAAMVLGPLAARQVPREVANWIAASALELRVAGEDQQARERMAQALAWNPRNAAFHLQLAQWNREDLRYEDALADCNRALELAEGHPLVLIERSQNLQHLKRFQEAVDDWKAVAELNERRRLLPEVSVWNGLAYARAVAGIELEAALEDADRAAKREPQESAILDTRGYLYYRLGKYSEALKDLDAAVAGSEARLEKHVKQHEAETPSAAVDQRQAERERKSIETEFAVILYHRSLTLEKLDQPEAAAADRDRVRQLGHTPGDELF